MLCERCHKRQATVYLQQDINGEKAELHLCMECATKMEDHFSMDDMLQTLIATFYQAKPQAREQRRTLVCPSCGLSLEEFRQTGRLGCVQCYDTFSRELAEVFKNIQGSDRHEGKTPQKAGAELLAKRQMDRLRLALARAVEKEEYEEAAKFRDQIRELERSSVKEG